MKSRFYPEERTERLDDFRSNEIINVWSTLRELILPHIIFGMSAIWYALKKIYRTG